MPHLNVASHVTSLNQTECFISEKNNNKLLKTLIWSGPDWLLLEVLYICIFAVKIVICESVYKKSSELSKLGQFIEYYFHGNTLVSFPSWAII